MSKYYENSGIKDLGQNFWNLGRTWDIHDRVVHIKPIIYKPKSQSQLQETK